MTDLTQMEHGALRAFLAAPGPVRSGLERFVSALAEEYRRSCTAAMASVPRQIEIAADCAAKAQVLDEFWAALTDELVVQMPEPESEQVL